MGRVHNRELSEMRPRIVVIDDVDSRHAAPQRRPQHFGDHDCHVHERNDEHFSRRTLVCHEEGQHASREHEVGEAHPCSRIAARQHYHEHAA
ncbi:MAG: hypothetical protein ACLSIH_10060 [Eggerthella lenta]|uniref:hypothetical protein n=1 Tax=Eggerthella lenta TaxID=84112 RepID=UPI00215DA382|nr:hypothetical protein [Eggerthella lenta]